MNISKILTKTKWVCTLALMTSAAAGADHPFFDTSGKFAGSLFCTPEASGGVSFDDASGKWKATTFRLGEPQIIRLKTAGLSTGLSGLGLDNKPGTVMLYEVTVEEMGSNTPVGCGPKLTISNNGYFECTTSRLEAYQMALVHMRFKSTYLAGYVNGSDNNNDTPSITVGKCGRIN